MIGLFKVAPISFKTKCSPMSNAKMLSKSALWETVFGGNPVAIRPFIFRAGIKTVGHGPTFDRCVVVYGENEQQARASAGLAAGGALVARSAGDDGAGGGRFARAG